MGELLSSRPRPSSNVASMTRALNKRRSLSLPSLPLMHSQHHSLQSTETVATSLIARSAMNVLKPLVVKKGIRAMATLEAVELP